MCGWSSPGRRSWRSADSIPAVLAPFRPFARVRGDMRTLYHLSLSAPSRIARVALAEKKLEFDPKVERVWERRDAFLAMSPAGEVPVLVDAAGPTLNEAWVLGIGQPS